MKDLCERCSRCCRLKMSYRKFYIALDQYCPQHKRLDNLVGFCKIYGKHTGTRIGNDGICLSVEQMIEQRLLPEDCPYVKEISNYRTLVVNYEDRKEKA